MFWYIDSRIKLYFTPQLSQEITSIVNIASLLTLESFTRNNVYVTNMVIILLQLSIIIYFQSLTKRHKRKKSEIKKLRAQNSAHFNMNSWVKTEPSHRSEAHSTDNYSYMYNVNQGTQNSGYGFIFVMIPLQTHWYAFKQQLLLIVSNIRWHPYDVLDVNSAWINMFSRLVFQIILFVVLYYAVYIMNE